MLDKILKRGKEKLDKQVDADRSALKEKDHQLLLAIAKRIPRAVRVHGRIGDKFDEQTDFVISLPKAKHLVVCSFEYEPKKNKWIVAREVPNYYVYDKYGSEDSEVVDLYSDLDMALARSMQI